MKVVVAGGSGLVGRHLVRSLVEEGHDVVVLTRDARRAGALLPQEARLAVWDPAVPTAELALLLANASAVVNLCGASLGRWPWTGRRRLELRGSRLAPTNALVSAMALLAPSERPAALINASGSDLYDGRDAEPASEVTPPTDTFLARLCVEWEAAARRAESLSVRVVLLRMGLVVAPDAPALQGFAMPVRLFGGGPIGSGSQWVSWIDVEDAVGLIRRAITAWDITGPLNVAAPRPVRQHRFARILGAVLRRRARIRTPAWLVRLMLGEQAALVLGSRRVRPAAALGASYEFRQPSLARALAGALRSSGWQSFRPGFSGRQGDGR